MKKLQITLIFLFICSLTNLIHAQKIDSTSYNREEDEDENEKSLQTGKGMQTACGGTELWSLKVLTDPAASTVNYTPVASTVANLVALTTPTPSTTMPRTAPIETTTYIINCNITIKKTESDNDYHLVLSDGTHTLIGEIPDPNCTAALTSSHRAEFVAAKAFIDANIASGNVFTVNIAQVTVTGVGFIDPPHGQTGAAPNNLELHPILDIHFASASQPPAAAFTPSATACAGQAIALTDNSTNGPTSWHWTMTGGTPSTSTLQNPTVTYTTSGSHTVTLTATNSSGTSSAVSHTITVNANPAVPTITLTGSTLSSSAATGNQWYLNGVLITGAVNQTFSASSSGAYTVTVTNSNGCSSTSAVKNYTNNNPPVANFSISAGDCEGQAITLTDNSSNTPTSWSWTMAGGTPASSTLHTPSVTYSTSGTYTVTLVSTNSSGSSSSVSHTVTVNANPPIPTITVAGTILTSSAAAGNQWNLNGIRINGDSFQTDTVTSNGLYTVTATNSFGCSSTSSSVNVNNSNPPVADFTSSTPACAGQANTLADNSTNSPTSWSWTMPGGTPASSALQNPTVTYANAGTYTITLTASNSFGASTALSHTITVNANPSIPIVTENGDILNASIGSRDQWYLNGILINGDTVQTDTATANGSYAVVVTNSSGCSSASASIMITTTDITSLEKSGVLTVFPNPSNGNVTINFTENSKNTAVEIMNDLGQLVYSENISDSINGFNKTIDMSSFKPGIYLFRIAVKETVYTKKVLLIK